MIPPPKRVTNKFLNSHFSFQPTIRAQDPPDPGLPADFKDQIKKSLPNYGSVVDGEIVRCRTRDDQYLADNKVVHPLQQESVIAPATNKFNGDVAAIKAQIDQGQGSPDDNAAALAQMVETFCQDSFNLVQQRLQPQP